MKLASRISARLRDTGLRGASRAVARAAGRGAFRLRHARPWQADRLDLARSGGLGDVLMCTPVAREIKRRNPDCRIRFFTDYGDLVRGLPQFDEVLPFEAHPWTALHLEYRAPVPVGRHLAQAIAADLGMEIEDVRPDCVVRPEADDEADRLTAPAGRRPVVLLQRSASGWTPNKDWPADRWRSLAEMLRPHAFLIEIGGAEPEDSPMATDLDLRGATPLATLAALVASADLLIGPDSGPIHLAAAFETPSITIYGGYLHPTHTAYRRNVAFDTPLWCAPCWLRAPCPYGLPCMTAIAPRAVADAAQAILRAGSAERRVLTSAR